MKVQLTATIGLFVISTLLPTTAFAQSDEECATAQSEICGNLDTTVCFDVKANWDKITTNCIGYTQTTIEMARESEAEMAKEGASWGGSVRSGAGTNFAKIGSLAEGTLVSLEENTGVMMNDYPWFKIIHYDNKTGTEIVSGYQWGGILCAFDERAGVYKTCPVEWSDNPARSSQGSIIGEDPIAPIHGNSDEDNEMIAEEKIVKCLERENNNNGDGSKCIGEVSDECLDKDREYTTLSMRQCINLEVTAWDNLLNEDYSKLMNSLDTDAKKTKLRDAQRLWVKFVGKFCSLGYEFNQGTMFLLTGDQCRMEMTARQDLELRSLANPLN